MRAFLAICALGLSVCTSALAAPTALVGATLADGSGPPRTGQTLIFDQGKIMAVGANLPLPAGTTIIDAAGRWVTPGLMTAFSRTGLMDTAAVASSNDAKPRANLPFSAAIEVANAYNPRSAAVAVTRIDGVTRAVIAPDAANNPFAGFGALVRLSDANGVQLTRAFQYLDMTEASVEEAYGSRAAAWLAVRTALAEARDYDGGRASLGSERDGLLGRLDTQSLVPVVAGRIPLLVGVERAADIRQMLALKALFPALRLIVLGGAEAWLVAPELAAARVPVILDPLNNLPDRFETLGATLNNAGLLTRAGVLVAIGNLTRDEGFQARLVRQFAGVLVGQGAVPGGVGVSEEQALAMLTRNPAQIFGVDDSLGSLTVGKAADIVLWSGEPLELMSAPVAVFIDGQPIPLVSRQTLLRDRYGNLQPKVKR